jgi:hypothetical protein
MVCVPSARLEMIKSAAPEARPAEPNETLPSSKLTIPVGTPVPDTGLTST